jgi:predicted hydrolase (HD superfamily)
MIPSREDALKILDKYVDNINLKRHMFAVEASMRALAKKFGENEDKWGITGLLHDADWEKHPTEHPKVIVKELREAGVDEDIAHAIASHGDQRADSGEDRFEKRESLIDKALFAADEISGFVVACAIVRPDKLDTLETKSVMKKLKDKSFAAQVSREDINKGAEELGVPLEDHITLVIEALRGIKSEFGF